MRITEEMVFRFNNMLLLTEGCSFKLQLNYGVGSNMQCEIVPRSGKFLDSWVLNASKEFYFTLEKFFKSEGIELSYNNDGSIFWSKSGFTDKINI